MAQEINAARKTADTGGEDDVEKFLSEQKAIEGKRQELIKELLRQKEAAIKAFDDKLAKLDHHEGARAPKRNHHKHDGDKKTG